jgi:hypothetical protein
MKTDIQIGQIVTTYYAGYFEVTRIEQRWLNKTKETAYEQSAYCIRGEHTADCGEEMNPIIYFKQLYDAKGNPKKSKEKGCDSSFCKLAKESIEAEINSLQEIINKLSNIKTN